MTVIKHPQPSFSSTGIAAHVANLLFFVAIWPRRSSWLVPSWEARGHPAANVTIASHPLHRPKDAAEALAPLRVRLGRVFRGFDQERLAFGEQSAHGSPILIVELDFQELVPGRRRVVGRRETTSRLLLNASCQSLPKLCLSTPRTESALTSASEAGADPDSRVTDQRRATVQSSA
jgi:hypothetical protein